MNRPQPRQPLLIGQSDFREFRKAGAYYVDKSLLIQELLEGSFQVVLLPRPRRFGKTLNLSMLRYFFEKSDESRETLFDDLLIRQYQSFAEHQDKRYATELEAAGVKDILQLAVAFRGKELWLKETRIRRDSWIETPLAFDVTQNSNPFIS